MTAVKPVEMGLFVVIAGPGIQYNIPSIFNFHQKQSVRRGGCTGVAAIFGCQNVAEIGGGDFAEPDVHQGSDNISHHIAQKAVGLNFEYE